MSQKLIAATAIAVMGLSNVLVVPPVCAADLSDTLEVVINTTNPDGTQPTRNLGLKKTAETVDLQKNEDIGTPITFNLQKTAPLDTYFAAHKNNDVDPVAEESVYIKEPASLPKGDTDAGTLSDRVDLIMSTNGVKFYQFIVKLVSDPLAANDIPKTATPLTETDDPMN